MSHSLHILFVDTDTDSVQRAGADLQLEFPDAKIDQISTAEQLDIALQAGAFDAIITEACLPWGDAFSILRLVKANRPDCPIVVFAADANASDALDAFRAGADDYVFKTAEYTARLPLSVRFAIERAALRKANRQAEARYYDLFEQASDGIFIVDAQGKYVEVNESGCQMLGYTREEVLQRNMRDLIPEEDRITNPIRFTDLRNQQCLIHQRRLLCKDGSLLSVEISARALPDGSFQGIVRDISQRLQAETDLRESQERLQRMNRVMRMVSEINELIVREKERSRLLEAACQTFVSSHDYAYAWVSLLADDGVTVKQAAASTPTDPDAFTFRLDDPAHGPNCAQQALQRRAPFRVESLPSGDPCPHCPQLAVAPERSALALPLLRAGRILGVLVVHAPYADAFKSDETGILRELADDLAYALESLEADEQRRANLRHLALLNEITQAALATPDFQTLLQTLADRMGDVLGADSCYISLWDEVRGLVVPAAASGPLRQQYTSFPPVTIESSNALRVLQAGHAVVIEDMHTTDAVQPALTKFFPENSVIGLPLIAGGQKLGAAYLCFMLLHHFSPSEIAHAEQAAAQIALAIARARLFEIERRRAAQQSALVETAGIILSTLAEETLWPAITSAALNTLAADRVAVYLYDPKADRLSCPYASGLSAAYVETVNREFHNIPGSRLIRTFRPVSIADGQTDLATGPIRQLLIEQGIHSYAIFPLNAPDLPLGAFVVYRNAINPFTEDDMAVGQTLAYLISAALQNARLFGETLRAASDIAGAYEATLEGWVRALDLRDRETEGHTRRVTELTLHLCRFMGISEENLVHVRHGALLHDIGKMGIPDNILHKPGPLTEAEQVIARRHPVHAYNMLAPIEYLRSALDIPYAHHEKWDGSGYPRGLKGEEIPLSARIFAVVDVWDALLSERPYHEGWGRKDALGYIRAQAGAYFDPQVVEKFVSLINEMDETKTAS